MRMTLSERRPGPPLNLREKDQPYPGSLSLTEEVQGSRGSKLGSTGISLKSLPHRSGTISEQQLWHCLETWWQR